MSRRQRCSRKEDEKSNASLLSPITIISVVKLNKWNAQSSSLSKGRSGDKKRSLQETEPEIRGEICQGFGSRNDSPICIQMRIKHLQFIRFHLAFSGRLLFDAGWRDHPKALRICGIITVCIAVGACQHNNATIWAKQYNFHSVTYNSVDGGSRCRFRFGIDLILWEASE